MMRNYSSVNNFQRSKEKRKEKMLCLWMLATIFQTFSVPRGMHSLDICQMSSEGNSKVQVKCHQAENMNARMSANENVFVIFCVMAARRCGFISVGKVRQDYYR